VSSSHHEVPFILTRPPDCLPEVQFMVTGLTIPPTAMSVPVFISNTYPHSIPASHNLSPGSSRRVLGRLGRRTPLPRPKGHTGNFVGRVVSKHCIMVTLFNDPSRKIGLTGAFLFATTTAHSSNALLGWNCAYVFFSNVRHGC
jgi:hypothetical protein